MTFVNCTFPWTQSSTKKFLWQILIGVLKHFYTMKLRYMTKGGSRWKVYTKSSQHTLWYNIYYLRNGLVRNLFGVKVYLCSYSAVHRNTTFNVTEEGYFAEERTKFRTKVVLLEYFNIRITNTFYIFEFVVVLCIFNLFQNFYN